MEDADGTLRANGAGDEHDKHDKKRARSSQSDVRVFDAEIAKVLCDAGDCGMTVKDIVTKLPGSTYNAVDGRLRRSNVFRKLAPGVWSCADAFESPEAFENACDAAEDAQVNDDDIAKVLRDAGGRGMTVKDIVTKLPGSTYNAVDGRLRRSNVFVKRARGVWSCADAEACDAAEDAQVNDADIAKVLRDAGGRGMTVKDIVTKLPGSTYNAVDGRLRRSNVFVKRARGVWSCADAEACDAAEDAQVNDADIAKVLCDAGDCGMTVKDIVTKLPGSTYNAVDGRLRRSNVFRKLAPGVWSCADAFESPEAFKIACDAAEDALSKDFSWGGDEDANGKRYEDKVILTHRVARGEVSPPAGTPAVSPSLHFLRGQTASLPEVIARSNRKDFGPSVHNLSLSKVFGKAIDEVFNAIEASPREPPTNGLLIIPGWERACRSVHTKTLREMRDNAVAGKLCALVDLIVDCLERNDEIVKRLAKHELKVQDIICSHIEDKTFFKSDGKSRARHGHGHRAGVSKRPTAPHQDHGVNPVTFSARRALPDVRTINGVRYVFGRLPDWYVRHMESAFKNPSYANGSSIEARARHRSVVEKLVYELNDSERPSYGFVMDSAENAYFTHGVENDNGEAWSMMQIVLDGGVDYETMRLIAQDLREASGDVLQPTRREVVSPKTKDLTTKDANEQKYTGLPLPVVAAADEDDDEDEDEDEDDDDDDDEDEDEDEDDEDDEDDDDDDDDDDVPLSCWVSGV